MIEESLKKLVSVIIPAYNAAETIKSAVESVASQTYKNIEILIIDDGSIDSTFAIANELSQMYKKNYIRIISQVNSGAASARNNGILNSNGFYIAFLDSDDLWHPTKLEEQISVFDNDPEVVLVGSFTNMKNNSFFNKLNTIRPVISISYFDMLVSNRFQTSTVIVKREILNEVGLFPFGQRYAEEGDLFLRISYKFKTILINKIFVNYSSGKSGFGHSGLSSNLTKMWLGESNNYYRAFKRKEINFHSLVFWELYSFLKYIRRIIINSINIRIKYSK